MGKLVSILLMSMSLPPLEREARFNPASLYSNSTIGSCCFVSLYSALKGKPKYLIGKLTSIWPKTLAQTIWISCCAQSNHLRFSKIDTQPRNHLKTNQYTPNVEHCSLVWLTEKHNIICKNKWITSSNLSFIPTFKPLNKLHSLVFINILFKVSITIMNNKGDKGSPYLIWINVCLHISDVGQKKSLKQT